MIDIAFRSWPKTPRLFRDSVITEKIDGTNGAIGIYPADNEFTGDITKALHVADTVGGRPYLIYAQSRNRIITPEADNYGFAAWVYDNAYTLIADLGQGLHFGEWWGQGIQRGYGLDHREFALFNTHKWSGKVFSTWNLGCVPVLKQYTFNTYEVTWCLRDLAENGSRAAPGFKPAEGVVVYHSAASQVFKALIDNDHLPKTLAASQVPGKEGTYCRVGGCAVTV